VSGVIRWEEPPPSQTGNAGPAPKMNALYASIRADLMSKPGEWAVVWEGGKASARALANQMRRGMYTAFCPVDRFEFASRITTTGGAIYARYIGES